MIESGGEMPEVSLAESLQHLGPVDSEGLRCLQAAVARRYLAMIRRDLDPGNRGASHFRGVERALANLRRLENFLSRVGWELPAAEREALGRELTCYMLAEEAELAAGRGYVTCRPEELRELLSRLGRDPGQAAALAAAGRGLPLLDFLGLAALGRISGVAGRLRRRQLEDEDQVCLEVIDDSGRVKAAAVLSLSGPAGPDPQAHQRARLVWRLAGGD